MCRYSGAAWATIADFESEQINLITTWPGTGREEGKAPTELYYEQGQVMWGYTIPPDAEPLRWFKLLLLREEDLAPELRQSEFILRGRKLLREHNKSATDLAADYLRLLWKHILDTIYKARGESVVDALQSASRCPPSGIKSHAAPTPFPFSSTRHALEAVCLSYRNDCAKSISGRH